MVTSVPKTCRAGATTNIGKPDYKLACREDYPVPEPKEGELLLELHCTGICQSDHHFLCGDWGLVPAPGIDCSGHEGAGTVAAVGKGVTGWKVGDRAGITPVSKSCEKCEFCKSGHETLCTGGLEYVAVHTNGSYTQYPTIPAQWAIKLPDDVPFEQLAPFMCSGGTAYTAVKAAECKPGDVVVVMGAGGGVGHMVSQFALAKGLTVVGVDVGADKEKTVKETGVEHFIDATDKDIVEKIQKIDPAGLGAHAVIVAVGNGAAYKAAPSFLRPLGTVVCVGLPPAGTAVAGTEPSAFCFKGIKVRGILVTTREDMKDALKLLQDGKIKEHLNILPFSAFPKALADVAASKAVGRNVIVFNKD